MGSNSDEPYFWGAEAPRHKVYLDEFWIALTEVTNKTIVFALRMGLVRLLHRTDLILAQITTLTPSMITIL